MVKAKEVLKYCVSTAAAVILAAAICIATLTGPSKVDATSVKFTPSVNGFSVQMISQHGTAVLAGVRSSAAESGELIYGVGDFSWPIPGCYELTSLFGNRIHPITGKANYHTGIDISAVLDTPIQAAKDGEVIISGWDNSYGNYVKIKHDNGMCTLYAHMHTRACYVGDYVVTGQVIGYVDSTGSSTGNHLHFEIHSDTNWTRVDPVEYFPDLLSDYM